MKITIFRLKIKYKKFYYNFFIYYYKMKSNNPLKKGKNILCFFKNPLYKKDKITIYKFDHSKNIMILSKKI
jgi:hypothetical protein